MPDIEVGRSTAMPKISMASPRVVEMRLFQGAIFILGILNVLLIVFSYCLLVNNAPKSDEFVSAMKTVLIASAGGLVGFLGGRSSSKQVKDE